MFESTASPTWTRFRPLPKLHEVAEQLGDQGRLVLRYSGTEPLARVMIEGPDHDSIEAMATKIVEAIRSEIGAEQR
ncbi:MAG: hypothetical protein P8Y44_05155 [Acidobacteriota bacterium]